MKLVELITAPGAPKLKALVVAREPVAPAEIVPRLTVSPFEIDHRAELLKEMRADADELDKRAAQQTAIALSLRLSADHLEANPPEP